MPKQPSAPADRVRTTEREQEHGRTTRPERPAEQSATLATKSPANPGAPATRTVQVKFEPELTLDYVLARVSEPEQCSPGQFLSWCPAHADEGSGMKGLSITLKGDGRVLLFCHSGCTHGTVLDALRAARPHEPTVSPSTGKYGGSLSGWRFVEGYRYTNDEGAKLYDVLRYECEGEKTFRRSPAGARADVPYRLPRVLVAIEAGETVFVVEGEKDVKAIERAGGVATTNASGAGKWTAEHSAWLAWAEVVIVADDDETGWAHARAVAESLQPFAKSIRVVKACAGKDASDHLDAGFGLDEFEEADLDG
jgi:5S rRNA maturation endonuclease (ribonuclease M5)